MAIIDIARKNVVTMDVESTAKDVIEKMDEERIGDYVKDNNIVASENTKYMNVVELAKLLNLEKKYIEEIEDLDNLIKKAIMKDDNALEKLEILSEEAITRLRKNNKYCNRLLRPKKGKK